MTHIEDDQNDKPLDPAMENIRRKMIKLQLVSAGIMVVLFLAVLAAIVYRLTREEGTAQPAAQPTFTVPSDQPLERDIVVPVGFQVTATSIQGSQMLVQGRMMTGQTRILVYDLALGRITADVTLITP